MPEFIGLVTGTEQKQTQAGKTFEKITMERNGVVRYFNSFSDAVIGKVKENDYGTANYVVKNVNGKQFYNMMSFSHGENAEKSNVIEMSGKEFAAKARQEIKARDDPFNSQKRNDIMRMAAQKNAIALFGLFKTVLPEDKFKNFFDLMSTETPGEIVNQLSEGLLAWLKNKSEDE